MQHKTEHYIRYNSKKCSKYNTKQRQLLDKIKYQKKIITEWDKTLNKDNK